MTPSQPSDKYRKAMEAEDGEPVSAGARVAHVKAAAESGRIAQFDLTAVPVELRPALLVEIRELIRERAIRAARIGQIQAGNAAGMPTAIE